MFNMMMDGSAANNKESQVQALSDKLAQMELDLADQLAQYELNLEDLLSFVESVENQDAQTKQILQRAREDAENCLEQDLAEIESRASLKERYKERAQSQNWLFVR